MKTNWVMRGAALAIGFTLCAVVVAPTPSPALASSASSALDWIEKELAASGHRFQGSFQSGDETIFFDDIGLTIDGLLAVSAGGRAADAEAKATSDYVVAHASDYATGGVPTDRYAGALGKLLLLANVRGLSTQMGSLNVESELRQRMQTTGPSAGRFSDHITDTQFGDDFSNGIGDAIDVIALAGTDDGVPAQALTWLRNQQCDNGGFRSSYEDDAPTCTANAQSDLDATSFALLALAASGDESAATDEAFADGLDFVLDLQADDGSFASGNGNSTGLAASVLRSVGDAPDANRAAAFVMNSLQLTSGADKGAIALDKAGADAAKANGVTAQSRPTFQRATPQAVLALGLPSYIDIGAVDPVEPSTTASVSSSSVAIGSPVTATGQGFLAGEAVNFVLQSDPITVGSANANGDTVASLTFNAPAAAGAGPHTLTLTGVVSGATVSVPLTLTAASTATTVAGAAATATTTTTATKVLARAGDDTDAQLSIALALLVAGSALVMAARRRRVIYPFKR